MRTVSCINAADSQPFDFIVVGGGSAGATLAARLAEDSRVTVALVEAGTHASELDARMPVACGKMQQGPRDWQFKTEPSETAFESIKDRRNLWPRGKCLGGSSVLNYMAYVRGSREDYNTWAKDFGAAGWSWDEMLPFFKKSEDFLSLGDGVTTATVDAAAHGTGGPLGVSVTQGVSDVSHAFVAGAQEMGFTKADYNNGDMFNVVSLLQQTIRNGVRSDTNTAFIASQPDKANLTVVVSAQCAKVLLVENNGSKWAVGIEAIDLSTGKRVQLRCKKEVIISCGAIQSPHVLMLSGVGAEAELARAGIQCQVDLPGVGKEMEDHICNVIRFGARDPTRRMTGLASGAAAEGMPGALPALLSWAVLGTGLHASSSYDSTLFYKSAPFQQSHPGYGPDSQIGLFCSPGDATVFESNLNIVDSANFHKPHYQGGDGQSMLMVPTLLHPHSRGRIEVHSADPLAHPKIFDNFLTDARDMQALVNMYRKCLDLAETPAMRAANVGAPIFDPVMLARHNGDVRSDAFLQEFARSSASTLYHPTSTCKIGKVVDVRLKVYGVEGLRVADASVMPTVISGNTNAPCIAIGERAAHFIKEEYNMKDTVVTGVGAPGNSFRYTAMALGVGAVAAFLHSKFN